MTSNCANVDDIQCESIGTEDVLSMCVVPVKVQHSQFDKEIITFAMLDTFRQGIFVTKSLMEQLSVKGIPTYNKIKILIGHQAESSELVKGLLVTKASSQNQQQKRIRLPTAFYKKEIPVEPCEIAMSGKLQRWKYLERIFGEISNNENVKVDLLVRVNCLEELESLEVILNHDKGPYAFRTALGWCFVGPIKAQQQDVISCNGIGVIRAITQDTAEHHFESEKKCEDFGVKEMLKKM